MPKLPVPYTTDYDPTMDGLPLDPAAILMRDVLPEEVRELYRALREALEGFRSGGQDGADGSLFSPP